MIVVVSYGSGNVRSVVKMYERIGIPAVALADPEAVAAAERLVLPGVGSFDSAAAKLRESGLEEPLTDAVVRRGVPVLGVCLGMQLFARRSAEGSAAGLGWLDADVARLDDSGDNHTALRLPHMGWAAVRPVTPNPLLPARSPLERFYFVHTYHVCCADPGDVLGVATYGVEFTAAVHRDNIWGVQFHPEKSHRFGMDVLRRFAEI